MPDTDVATDTEHGSRAVLRFTAIGTDWQINTAHPLPDPLRAEIAAMCEDFDRAWSRFRTDSLVTEIAQAPRGGRFSFPARDTGLLFSTTVSLPRLGERSIRWSAGTWSCSATTPTTR